MKGHDGKSADLRQKVANPADAWCTWAVQEGLSTGNASLFDCPLPDDKPKVSDSNRAGWLPTTLSIYTPVQLESFWKKLRPGDRYGIYWSYAEDPLKVFPWTGEKVSDTKAKYASDDSTYPEEAWPPAANVRVHALQYLQANTLRGQHGGRLRHTAPAKTLNLHFGDVAAALREFSTEQWVKWAGATPSKRTLPRTFWPAWSSIVREF